MINPTPVRIPCEQLLHEHAAVCELVRSLYRAFAERHEPVARLSQMVAALRERVEAHLVDEETADLFGELRRRAPQRLELIQHLAGEHLELRDKLRGLALALEVPHLTAEVWDALEHRFREFSNQLMHHEATENDLIQRVYDEDLGAHD